MMRPAISLLLATALTLAAAPASAQAIYRWRDANGGLHFSNQSKRAPTNATEVELPPLGTIEIPTPAKRMRAGRSRPANVPPAMPCGPADPTGLAESVMFGLPSSAPVSSLTLLVGGLPVSTTPDASVQLLVTPWDPDAPQAHLSQSAIAYPLGASCPDAPPLVRYPTNARRETRSRGLCDDYRRAFAQVGVATSRDAGVARSFHDIARAFVRVRHEGNNAVASGFRVAVAEGMFTSDAAELAPFMTIPLDPWIVAAHTSQTESLATESDELVDQLTVALEEIDRAARAIGCWN